MATSSAKHRPLPSDEPGSPGVKADTANALAPFSRAVSSHGLGGRQGESPVIVRPPRLEALSLEALSSSSLSSPAVQYHRSRSRRRQW